jgi:hypothetical protein
LFKQNTAVFLWLCAIGKGIGVPFSHNFIAQVWFC